MIESVFYNVGIYCRLSLDDGSVGESGSIQTQKMMLEKYCKDNHYTIKEIYIDDGVSGLTFNRSGFQRMLKDIEAGKINMVITKDLSRLGRDYLQTGYYTEQYFPLHNVRYIAINDGIDTLLDNNDIAPFKNILNDMYAKDLSRKVKSAKRQRALNGLFISAQTPYGYIKDPTNKNHLIVDEDVRHIVELIFKLCKEGNGAPYIAKYLEEKQILNPAAYKSLKGDTRFDRYKDEPYKWKAVTVRKILTDMVYLGHMENGKYKVENYKTKKLVRVPDEEHIIVKNTHEAIISEEDFYTVQTVMKKRHYPAHHQHENLFKSILFCTCGKRMAIAHKVRKNKTDTFYKCSNHENNPQECPKSNIVQYSLIKKLIEAELMDIIKSLKNNDDIIKRLEKHIKQNNTKNNSGEIKKTESRLNQLVKIASKLYEDYTADLINDRTYKELLLKNKQEQDLLELKLKELRNGEEVVKNKLNDLELLKSKFYEYIDNIELTAEMVNSLIERIELGYMDIVDEKKQRTVNIYYKFIDMPINFD